MNLTKLFNFKYFKENLKKSKGVVALLLTIIPIFTLLFVVLALNSDEYISVPEKGDISFINYFGMYSATIVISYILFGYVYKKKSVDFINSQPINRKTIFFTNTIGGILLIGLIQLITAIVLLICSLVLPNIIIFSQMIFDCFLLFWIGYSFVFVATNLAMTISGTFCTQLVLTMLILFLVPFCMDSSVYFRESQNYNMIVGEESYNIFLQPEKYYTLPYQPFHMMFSTGGSSNVDWFSSQSVSRMLVLGIIYYFVGLHLFKKRKMENNEESFFNEKMHVIVKALTILPMIIILNIVDAGTEFNIFAVALIITYYFIYDFIVKRKMKLKSSIIYLILTLVALQGLCSIVSMINVANILHRRPELNVEDIAEIRIDSYNYMAKNEYYVNNEVLKFGGYIDNKDIIKTIFESKIKEDAEIEKMQENAEVIEVIGSDTEIVETATPTTIATNEEDYYRDYSARCNISIKTKMGKVYYMQVSVLSEDFKDVIKKLSEDEEYVSNIKNTYTKEGIITINNLILVENEEKEELNKEIENIVNNMELQELIEINNTTETAGINRYFYKNHKLQGVACQDSLNENILKFVSKRLNDATIKMLREEQNYHNFNVFPKNLNYRIYFSSLSNEVREFILNSKSEEFDVTKPYYVINLGGRHTFQFYTNKVEEIEQFIAKQIEYDDNIINYNKGFIEDIEESEVTDIIE